MQHADTLGQYWERRADSAKVAGSPDSCQGGAIKYM